MDTYVTFYFSIHQLRDIWVVSTSWPLWITPMWILIQVFCGHMFSYFLSVCLWVELLGHVIVLCLPFWGTAKLFSKVAVPIFIPTSSAWGFQSLSIVYNTCYWSVFDCSLPNCCEVPYCDCLAFCCSSSSS